MSYRVCMSTQPGFLHFDDPLKWQDNQVHPEYPKMSGKVVPWTDIILISMLGNHAPNITVITEKLQGSFGKDGLPIGYYGSILNNQSDVTFVPVVSCR